MRSKQFRALLTVVLAASLLLSSCLKIQRIDGADGTETDPSWNAPETEAPDPGQDPEPLSPDPGPDENRIANFDLDLLTQQNLISSLLSRHDCVTVRREYDGGSEVECLWMRDGDLVYFDESKEIYEDGEYDSLYGYYRGTPIYPDGETTTCSHWVSASEVAYGGEGEYVLTDYLPVEAAGDILVLSEDENSVTVVIPEILVDEGGGEFPCENTVTVDKGTLDILSFGWEYSLDGEEHYGSFSVEYDGEQVGRDVMTAWDDTRTVSINIVTEEGERVENLEFPAAWGLFLYQDEGIILSSPDAEAGMAIDESMYVEPGGKTVTVYAWDEANYPTDIVTEPESLEELPFSLDDLRENNRVTNLLNKYGTLTLENQSEYGAYSTVLFRHDGLIVRYSYMEMTDEDGTVFRQGTGNYDSDQFELNEDGKGYTYYASVPDHGAYLIYDTNADGEHYVYDQILTDALMLGSASDIQSDGDAVSFRYQYDFDEEGDSAMMWVVGQEDVLVRSVYFGEMGMTQTVKLGEEVPFRDEFESMFQKTRTITCHFEGVGDYSYTLPADWTFVAGYFEELPCYTDAAMKEARDSRIPGDGKDYEIWVRTGETTDSAAVPEPTPEPEPEPTPEPTPEPAPEPDPISLYTGAWNSENGASEFRINPDGSFELTMGGDTYFGTLEWTAKERGLWASGGRYELILSDGTLVGGDGSVTSEGDTLTLCIGGGAERFRRGSLIGVRKVDGKSSDLPAHETFAPDRGEYAVDVLLEPYVKVSNFSLYSLKYEDAGTEGEPVFSGTELYRLASFTPEKPLLLTMTFGEIFPTYGFSYKDAAGEIHTYGIVESGMDGSAILTEIRIAMG